MPIEERWYISTFLRHNHIIFMILPENLGEKGKVLKTPIPEAKTISIFTVYECNDSASSLCDRAPALGEVWAADTAYRGGISRIGSHAALSSHF